MVTDKDAIAFFKKGLANNSPFVRMASAETLIKIEPKFAGKLIKHMLEDRNRAVKNKILSLLIQYKDNTAVAEVRKLLYCDKSSGVKILCMIYLLKADIRFSMEFSTHYKKFFHLLPLILSDAAINIIEKFPAVKSAYRFFVIDIAIDELIPDNMRNEARAVAEKLYIEDVWVKAENKLPAPWNRANK